MDGDTVIDVTRLVGRAAKGWMPTGIDRVILSYITHYGARSRALVRLGPRWAVLGDAASRRLFAWLRAPGFSPRIWADIASAAALPDGRLGLLLHLGHDGLDNPGYARLLRRHPLVPCFFLHDIIPLSHPEYCRPGEAARHHRRVETMLSTGRGLIANSADTRAAMQAYAVKQGWAVPECVVAPLAPAPLPPADGQRPLERPYFVILGTIEARKNHLLLLQLWRRLAVERGADVPHLVIIGQRGWECEQALDMLDRCAAIRGIVHEKPRCGDAALATWLRHAQALLFPSFAEGFGMPLVEALASGVPVIASDLAVFGEIAGGIPEYLDPLDAVAWGRAVLDYADPANARRGLQLSRMQGYAPPTWEGHFATVGPFIERCRSQG